MVLAQFVGTPYVTMTTIVTIAVKESKIIKHLKKGQKMKIYKNDYGFSTSAFSKNQNDGTENKYYVSVQFKKGTEPAEEMIEGELIFKSKDGTERTCFLSSYPKKDGTLAPKLIVMGTETPPQPTQKSVQGATMPTVNGVEVSPDDLPFY